MKLRQLWIGVYILFFSISTIHALGSDREDAVDKASYYFHIGEKDKAIELLQSSCSNGYEAACVLIVSWDYSLTKQEKQKKVLQHLKKGCSKNESRSCLLLGMMYAQWPDSVKQDINYGIKLLKKSCNLENPQACEKLGYYYYKTSYNPVLFHEYNNKAVKFYEKGCFNGTHDYCHSGGYMYAKGKNGLDRNKRKAKKLYEHGCKIKDYASCSALAAMYEYGEGVRQDRTKANKLYGISCDLKGGYACDDYKRLNEAGF